MADSLIDLYLGSGKATSEKEQSSSLTDMYLGSSPTASSTVETPAGVPRITVTPRVPQSDDPIEAARIAEANKDIPANIPPPSALAKAGSTAMTLPAQFGSNVAQSYKSGVNLATEGLGEVASNMPLGIGKVALGALGAVASPATGLIKTAVEDPVSKVFGKDVGERAGFVAGAALPVGPAIKATKAAMPTNKAITSIIDTIGQDNLPTVIQELKSNPRLSLMDVVPASRQMAQKLITNEGPHQNKFEKFVTDRVASGKDATSNIYDATMGTPVNVVDKVNSLKQAAKDVGKKEIQPAVNNAGFVDVSNVINNIDKKLKPGVNSIISAGEPLALGDIEKPLSAVRQFIMDEKSVRTDPKSLHQFQAALRAKADDMLNSTDGVTRQKGHALMQVRNDIVNAIDKASPRMANTPEQILKHHGYDEASIAGMDASIKKKTADMLETAHGKAPEGGSYKAALSKFRDEKQVENAFNMGQLVTRNKLGRLEDSPEFWDKWVKDASPQELEAAREGARLAVQHQIAGFKAGARKGQDIVESEFNKDKLSSLFGEKEVAKMAKELQDERKIAITNSKLIDNSQTAMRMKADSRVDLPVRKEGSLGALGAPILEMANMATSGIPGLGAAAYLGAKGASAAKFKYMDLPLAKARNSKITDYLTAIGEDRADLIRILESHIQQPKLSLANRARLALPTVP